MFNSRSNDEETIREFLLVDPIPVMGSEHNRMGQHNWGGRELDWRRDIRKVRRKSEGRQEFGEPSYFCSIPEFSFPSYFCVNILHIDIRGISVVKAFQQYTVYSVQVSYQLIMYSSSYV